MATTAIWDVQDSLRRVIDYATNPNKTGNPDFSSPNFQGLRNVLEYTEQDVKTEHQFYVTGINCDPATAYEDMSFTKRQFQKTGGILAYHGYQAFTPGEATAETAHAIGVKLAQELWGDHFEVVVSTHLDKHHLHNHFVLNSVSFLDGKRYRDNEATYAQMRKISDRLCREYSLSVIENPQRGKSKHYAEWKAEQEGKPTYRGFIREDVDKAISASMTFTQFLAELKKQGYEVKADVKYLAVRPPGKERYVRLKTLGGGYSEEAIKQRILQNHTPKRPEILQEPKVKHAAMKGSIRTAKKITGLQALYIHYLFIMGILPKKRASPKRTHFLLREDIRRLDEIIAQTRLLGEHHIETKEQLSGYRSTKEQELATLYDVRKSIYNKIRRCGDGGWVAAYKRQITGMTKQISLLRREVRLCAGILSRSDAVREKLQRVKQDEMEQRREENTYEQRSRRGRSNR